MATIEPAQDAKALDESELHRLARARVCDGGRNTVLDRTGLVHESYLRFMHAGELRAEDRRAFFAYASQVMRSVIAREGSFFQAPQTLLFRHSKQGDVDIEMLSTPSYFLREIEPHTLLAVLNKGRAFA